MMTKPRCLAWPECGGLQGLGTAGWQFPSGLSLIWGRFRHGPRGQWVSQGGVAGELLTHHSEALVEPTEESTPHSVIKNQALVVSKGQRRDATRRSAVRNKVSLCESNQNIPKEEEMYAMNPLIFVSNSLFPCACGCVCTCAEDLDDCTSHFWGGKWNHWGIGVTYLHLNFYKNVYSYTTT